MGAVVVTVADMLGSGVNGVAWISDVIYMAVVSVVMHAAVLWIREIAQPEPNMAASHPPAGPAR